MRSIKPHLASAPAKSNDAKFARIGVTGALGPGHGRVEIRRNLAVGNFCNHVHNLLRIVYASDVALAREECRRDREVPSLARRRQRSLMCRGRQNFVHHQDSGERIATAWRRAITWNLTTSDRNFDLARDQILLSVMIVSAETGSTASANPAARLPTTKARRLRYFCESGLP